MRQCLGLRETVVKVKVECGLHLFCSCAVQREVFSVREWGNGSLMSGECVMLCAMQGFEHVFTCFIAALYTSTYM